MTQRVGLTVYGLAERRRRAAATETRGDVWFKGVVNDYRAYFLGGVAGHCGLFSTAPDLAILSALWLGKGTYVARDGRRVKLFSPETCERVMAPQFVSTGVRGLNWDKRSGWKNRPWNMTPGAVGHGGWTGTSIWIDPKLDLFVVVLGNRRHPFGKTPNIYPAAAEVGVVAVNSLRLERRRPAAQPALVPSAPKSWAGRKVGLIVARDDVDESRAWPSQIQREGGEIVAVYFIDERSLDSGSDTVQRVPDPTKIHAQTGAPVYALNGACPRILPPMLRGADTLVFGARVPADCSDEAAWFMTSVMGHTLQSAADHRLRYGVIDYPNPLEKKRIEPTDATDRLKPFGTYYRAARSRGLTFGELSALINEDQFLGVKIEVVAAQSTSL